MRRPELGSLMAAVVIFLLFAITDASANHLWLKQTGLAAWTQQAAFFGILAVPVGLLMIGGEFDLSTGVMVGVTAIVMALLVGKYHWNTWLAIVATLLFASGIGLLNGYVVAKTKLPSFIVTLATFFVLRGVSVGGVLAAQQPLDAGVGHHAASVRAEQREVDLRLLVLLERSAPEWLQHRNHLVHRSSRSWHRGYSRAPRLATGSSRWAATRTLRGTPACRSTAQRSCCSCRRRWRRRSSGIISFTQASSAVSEQGVGYEFFYIIAAVVGGCLLTGGYGSAIGAALGACIIGMAFEGVIYAGWDSSWNFAFLGVILFLAVVVNTLIYRRATKARR